MGNTTRSHHSAAQAKDRQRVILQRATQLYPDLAPHLCLWRNRGKWCIAGVPRNVAVLGVKAPQQPARALLFEPSWRKLCAVLKSIQP